MMKQIFIFLILLTKVFSESVPRIQFLNEVESDGLRGAFSQKFLSERASRMVDLDRNFVTHILLRAVEREGLDGDWYYIYIVDAPSILIEDSRNFADRVAYGDVSVFPVRVLREDSVFKVVLATRETIHYFESDFSIHYRSEDGESIVKESTAFSSEDGSSSLEQINDVREPKGSGNDFDGLYEVFKLDEAEDSAPVIDWKTLDCNLKILNLGERPILSAYGDFVSSQCSGDVQSLENVMTSQAWIEVESEIKKMSESRYIDFIKSYCAQFRDAECVYAVGKEKSDSTIAYIAKLTDFGGGINSFAMHRLLREFDGSWKIDKEMDAGILTKYENSLRNRYRLMRSETNPF
ncbi:hypothetical protein QEH59_18000 [Coraliomargarita sp. SDUM461004]|uniref:Uncharacterized protein n=1 Tax=Thalassobacterium sedimentorum TaxID=3041258 RepID=A0ABU1ANL2_9BACT|nr:hypothetical protein [Coraliomargarita sp. SDUM461004]MDQ8196334.1 hypothetical protein [Coraliomargarita sp. SDUM461004]